VLVVARVTAKARMEISETGTDRIEISIPGGLLPVVLVLDRQGASRLMRLLQPHTKP
jgi:hypothetical protein